MKDNRAAQEFQQAERESAESTLLPIEEQARADYNNRSGKYASDGNIQYFSRIAAMWTAILGPPATVSPIQACLMMTALKLIRYENAGDRDSASDAIGYIICADHVSPRTPSTARPAQPARPGESDDSRR